MANTLFMMANKSDNISQIQKFSYTGDTVSIVIMRNLSAEVQQIDIFSDKQLGIYLTKSCLSCLFKAYPLPA